MGTLRCKFQDDPASSVRFRGRRSGARNGKKPTVKSSVKAANDNLDDNLVCRTREVWQPRLGCDLSHHGAKQMAANAAGFFSILVEWSQSELPAPANDNGATAAAKAEETHHER